MRRTLVACEAMDRILLQRGGQSEVLKKHTSNLAVVIDFSVRTGVTLLQRSARYPDQQGSSSSDAPSADFESKEQTTGSQATRWEVFCLPSLMPCRCARAQSGLAPSRLSVQPVDRAPRVPIETLSSSKPPRNRDVWPCIATTRRSVGLVMRSSWTCRLAF